MTGSCHVLRLDDGYTIMLDCGLYQGRDFDQQNFNSKWRVKPNEVDLMILSHAHIDHAGRIPKLVKDGYSKRIYCTHATKDLSAVMLMDSAYIQEKDAEWENKHLRKKGKHDDLVEPLYDADDVREAMNHFIGVPYEEWIEVNERVKFVFKDSGHILGSASITLKVQENGRWNTIGFTGDIGRPDRPILRDPVPMPEVDHLICESTYGNKFHRSTPDESERLLEIIKTTCVDQKGKLIIPAFSLGRTQEIVYLMDELEIAGRLPKIPVYVDSPLAISATEVFKVHPECFDSQILDHMVYDPNPFGWSELNYVRKAEDSKKLNTMEGPCIIISASGMITAGRIVHHIYNHIQNPRNTVLIVGYCAEHTLGAQIAKGKKTIKLFGEELQVKARVENMHSFSAHGDQGEMLAYIDHMDRNKLKNLFLVHGDYERQVEFREVLLEKGFKNVRIPDLGESFRLS